jgi:hypothetical protein
MSELKLEDSTYKVGDIVKLHFEEKWKYIEKVEVNNPCGYDTYCYKIRDGGWVMQSQIADKMDALPD